MIFFGLLIRPGCFYIIRRRIIGFLFNKLIFFGLWIQIIAPSLIFMMIILHHLLRHKLNLIPLSLDHLLMLFLLFNLSLVLMSSYIFRQSSLIFNLSRVFINRCNFRHTWNSIIWLIELAFTILMVLRIFLRKICEIFPSFLISSLFYRIYSISIGIENFLKSINYWIKTSIYHDFHFWI